MATLNKGDNDIIIIIIIIITTTILILIIIIIIITTITVRAAIWSYGRNFFPWQKFTAVWQRFMMILCCECAKCQETLLRAPELSNRRPWRWWSHLSFHELILGKNKGRIRIRDLSTGHQLSIRTVPDVTREALWSNSTNRDLRLRTRSRWELRPFGMLGSVWWLLLADKFLEITNLTHFFMYLFISCLYMFRESQCSSSGDRIVWIYHLVLLVCVSDCLVCRSGGHTKQSLTQTNHTR